MDEYLAIDDIAEILEDYVAGSLDFEDARDAIQLLVSLGAVVGRFERVGTSLADLIERVVLSAGGPNA